MNPAVNGKLTRIDSGNLGPAVLSGDGSTVVFNKYDGEQWDVFRHRGDRLEQLTTDPRQDVSPSCSRDGNVVAWSHYTGKQWPDGNYDVQKHVDGKIVNVATGRGNESDPRVSADGSTIVWSDDESDSPWGFDIFQEKNGVVSQVTDGVGVNIEPIPNQDGSRIYFRRKVAFDDGDLWMKDETGALKQLTESPIGEWDSVITTNGHTIAFSQDSKEGDRDVFWFHDKGGNVLVLAGEKKAHEVEPALSGDGSVAAYTRRAKGEEPRVLLLENGQATPIATDAPTFWPHLSEDGRVLTFAAVEKNEVVLYKLERDA